MTLGTSILIVDDDSQIRESLSNILENAGYIVQTAKNGKQATNLSKEFYFDIALVDINLPDIRGIDLLQRLKYLQHKIMTIMVTGSAEIKDTIDAVNQGTNGYIIKPVHPEKLFALIENLVKEKTTREIREWEHEKEYEHQKKTKKTGLMSHYKEPKKTNETPW